jgi:hypothetical protein
VRTLRIALGLLFATAPLAAQRRAGTQAPASSSQWQLAIGTSAGFVDIHPVGSTTDITALMFPSWGSAFAALAFPVSTIPALYMTIPISEKFALEPNLDIHRAQRNGPFTTFASDLGARMDYAFGRKGFYGAAGVHFLALKSTGSPTFAQVGLGVAGGYRFHLSGAWGGRFEISHTMMAKHRTAGIPPINTTALSFGAMVALK